MVPKGVYIHIPFCEHICYYCDFNKYMLAYQPVWDYLYALRREMKEAMQRFPSSGIETIYVGGGTPTALNHEQMAYFLQSVQTMIGPLADKIEYTMEANPSNLDREKLSLMKTYGVNRLSIGVQSFTDDMLAEIGRTHRRDDVFRAIADARAFGFDNISIDLMFRLPDQSREVLQDSVQAALDLDVDHVSIYALQIEPRTILYNRMRKGKLHLPDEDTEADMYEDLMGMLAEAGFHHYEVSNFAKPGYESRHNHVYWRNEDYYGLGAGSHGYINRVRRVNAGWTKAYIRKINETGDACVETHDVGEREKMEDEMFLGLRESMGVSRARFQQRYGRSVDEVFGEAIKDLEARQLITTNGDQITMTEQGFFLGNEVFQAFINTQS